MPAPRKNVYGYPVPEDDRPSVSTEYAREVLNKPREWFAGVKGPEYKGSPEAEKDIEKGLSTLHSGSYEDLANRIVTAQQPKDGSAGWIEKVSKSALDATKALRHKTGADKQDGTPEGDASMSARKKWHGSVAGLMKADEERKAREAQAGQFVEHPHTIVEGAAQGSESGPVDDIYGRPHSVIERYGENFYPETKPGGHYAPAPPGGDTYKDGQWGTVPRAPRESTPAEALPPPAPPAPASTEMLNHIQPVSFDYKPGYGAPGRNYGVLAQDLEKSPMGASLVKPDASGVKTVNVGKAAMANLAATADLHQRVKAIEEGGVDKDAQKRMRAYTPNESAGSESGGQQGSEVTRLTPQEDAGFKPWVKANGVRDLDHPDSHYDYRGAYAAGHKVGADQHWPDTFKQHGHPTFSEESQYSTGKGDGGTWQGDKFVTSDEVVKDDIRREGISPRAAYASRVNELTAMANAGHPEAPRKLETLEREGSAVGLGGTQAPAGNLLGDDRPTVATQYARKVYKATLGRDVAPPEPGSQMDNVQKELAGKDTVYGDTTPPPFERTPEAPGLAGEDKTLQGEVPVPKASDAPAEPEQGPPPPQQSPYSTIPEHYSDLIGKKNWDLLSAAEQAEKEAAYQIHRRNSEQAQKDTSAAETQVLNSTIEKKIAQDDILAAQGRGADLDKQARDIEADAAHLATYHENPDHFWQTRSTAQTIAGFIGIALGGFVQGVKGGENVALKQINHAIDRDIDAQRANYNAKKDSVAVKRSAYGMAMERYNHDDTKASAVLRMAALDKVAAEAHLTAAQHKGTEVDDRLNQFTADLADKKAKEGIQFTKYVEQRTVANGASMQDMQKEFGKYYASVTEKGEQPMPFAQWLHGRLGGQVPGSTWGASADRKHAAEEKQAESDQKRTIIVDGKPRLAVNTEVVKDWNDYSHSADEARRLLKVMESSKDGDPATYDAARAKMIEVLPQTFGYARGPSIAQVKNTFGPEAIPEYAHWYTPRLSSRADRKLLDLGKTLDTVDKSTREHTLAQTGAATIAPQGGTATPSTFKEAK